MDDDFLLAFERSVYVDEGADMRLFRVLCVGHVAYAALLRYMRQDWLLCARIVRYAWGLRYMRLGPVICVSSVWDRLS